jgi:hypothetical protein
VSDQPSDLRELQEKYPLEMLDAIPNGTIFSYNMDKGKDSDGWKVRWKIRVAAGPEATRWDARQAEAIREALLWLRSHPEVMTASE